MEAITFWYECHLTLIVYATFFCSFSFDSFYIVGLEGSYVKLSILCLCGCHRLKKGVRRTFNLIAEVVFVSRVGGAVVSRERH